MKKDKCGIYQIKNLVNGKLYIGYSKNIYKRWSRHRITLNNQKDAVNRHLQNAWNLYKEDSFKFDILEECSISDLNTRELYWISFLSSSKEEFGYNIVDEIDGWKKYKGDGYNRPQRVYKKIYKIDKTNQIIKIYESYLDICSELLIGSKKLQRILLNIKKKRYTYKGYFWIMEDKYDFLFDYKSLLKKGGWAKPKPTKIPKTSEERNIKRIPISLQNMDTQEIRNYKSLKEASLDLKFTKSVIHNLINGFKNKGGGKVVKISQWKGWQIYKPSV